MKPLRRNLQARPARFTRAFTLTELMVTIVVFSFLVLAGVYSHVLGLKMSAFTQTKLTATHNARAALNETREAIRAARMVSVGNGTSNTFALVTGTNAQQGNAVQVYPTTATNNFVRFYVDTSKQTLNRVVSGSTNVQVLANCITNTIPFHVEDFSGNTLTNSQNNRVICMTFELYQFEFAVLQPGSRAFYDYYRLQTKVARRAIP